MIALRDQVQTMAQHIQALTLLTVEQKRRIAALEQSARIVRLPAGKVRT